MLEKISATSATADRILDVAQKLVQTRGYNAFSYADIAVELNVTKASLHYHFSSKARLGHSLIERYTATMRKALDHIAARHATAAEKLDDYVAIYAGVLADRRMCLCGMLAAEFETLPKPMQSALDHFFDMNERWIERLLEAGRADGSLRPEADARGQAQFVVAALEGAMMLARSHGSPQRFHTAAARLLAELSR